MGEDRRLVKVALVGVRLLSWVGARQASRWVRIGVGLAVVSATVTPPFDPSVGPSIPAHG